MTKKKDVHAQTLKIPKLILLCAKFLELISPNLATLFAARLFTTPLKHKIPKREFHMNENSIQKTILIPNINKEIVVYHYGKSEKKVLLVHGWSGRGTQLVKIADELIELGYSTISFDAPAHGKSKGNSTIMTEFIASILVLEQQFGPFEFAIGHSLGGMSILNAIKQSLHVKKAVVIGSGDIIQDIIDDFVKKLKLNSNIGVLLRNHFERKYDQKMNDYSASEAAKDVKIPVLIVHDTDDTDVNVKAAHHIKENLLNSEIMITTGLGHRKILGNKEVINKVIEFIQK
ncbi:MAG: alpha/beta hydrolase [Flavobacterium sp.]|nr:alpha/beta hydrolase [Flavobacterium sp.]